MSEVVLIAAVGERGELGYRGALPWHLPDDLQRFKALTLGAPVVMGRKTWQSLGRPLPGRRNVVVSRTLTASDLPEGVVAMPTLEEALKAFAHEPVLFVIGGATLYAAALPFADRLELTEVAATVPADTFFPAWPRDAFVETARHHHPRDARHPYPFDFVTYRRRYPRTQSTK